VTRNDIDAVLRGATRDGILDGWYTYLWLERHWVTVPADGPRTTNTYVRDSSDPARDVVEYCDALIAAGVEPAYTGGHRRNTRLRQEVQVQEEDVSRFSEWLDEVGADDFDIPSSRQ
jgi:hypothetical protein